jgi:Coenzyme PQQ synthesis protein D (PqqD)
MGCMIWELIDGERTTADIVDAVRAGVEDAPDTVAAEVVDFIEDMRERNLIVA